MKKARDRFVEGRHYWYCSNYPECDMKASEHANGELMGTPATLAVRQLRTRAHKIAEVLWGKWGTPECNKQAMYDWLSRHTRKGHIGHMTKNELIRVIEKMEAPTVLRGLDHLTYGKAENTAALPNGGADSEN